VTAGHDDTSGGVCPLVSKEASGGVMSVSRCRVALKRSATCGHVRDVRSGSCARPWWPCANGTHDDACVRGSKVERCVSSRPTPSCRSGGADSSAGVIRSPCYRHVGVACQTLRAWFLQVLRLARVQLSIKSVVGPSWGCSSTSKGDLMLMRGFFETFGTAACWHDTKCNKPHASTCALFQSKGDLLHFSRNLSPRIKRA